MSYTKIAIHRKKIQIVSGKSTLTVVASIIEKYIRQALAVKTENPK